MRFIDRDDEDALSPSITPVELPVRGCMIGRSDMAQRARLARWGPSAAQRRGLEVGQGAPQPLHRAVAEAAEPQRRQHGLDRVHADRERDALRRAELAVEAEAVAVEEERERRGLAEVAAERRP